MAEIFPGRTEHFGVTSLEPKVLPGTSGPTPAIPVSTTGPEPVVHLLESGVEQARNPLAEAGYDPRKHAVLDGVDMSGVSPHRPDWPTSALPGE